ncbi:MAG: hypothetical protein JF593_03050 [Novosphingobium sp.]|nr:hypothetical protein [Novosphingobium sp.]
MGLLKPDFYRSFLVGFALGAAVFVGMIHGAPVTAVGNALVPPAAAAPVR